ncbi:MAG: MSCRAMM family protein [Blastocatellia bacterium]
MKGFFRLTIYCAILLAACFTTAFAQQGAQRGEITGRVVSEDGGGMPNVYATLFPAGTNQTSFRGSSSYRGSTDEEGNFKFSNLAPRIYSISVFGGRGYVRPYLPQAERRIREFVRVGDNVTVALIRGSVITGRVTTLSGEPMIGVRVSATMVRDPDGKPLQQGGFAGARLTDDRGVYRIYGLAPGAYIVGTQNSMSGPTPTPYEGNVATYYPSATRDTAAEVTVASGGETTGVDIRFRGERGHSVSGTVTGAAEPVQQEVGVSVSLRSAATGYMVAGEYVRTAYASSFAIHGVPDGEYELLARRDSSETDDAFAAAPRRVTVRGADVTGVELKLAPLASIAGKLLLESSQAACEAQRKPVMEEALLSLRRDPASQAASSSIYGFAPESAANEKGEFTIRYLDGGRYFLETRLPGENWYVKAIAGATAAAASRPSDLARSGITLKSGEKLSGVTVTIASGAAALSGKVIGAKDGAAIPSRLRVHLVPAEVTAAEDVLRYAEVLVRGDGAFGFTNLAPGRYLLLARPVPESEAADRPPLPAAWDATERAKLRKEAEAKKNEVELKPCQQLKDHKLVW